MITGADFLKNRVLQMIHDFYHTNTIPFLPLPQLSSFAMII